MAKPVPLQDRFTGMWRDTSRDQLPDGKVWNMADLIPNLGAPLRKRGGWSYHGSALTSIDASAALPANVGLLPFFGRNEIRTVFVNGIGIGGTFTLTFDGQTTGTIAWDASAATVLTALEALSNLAPGDITVSKIVSGSSASEWYVEFTGATYGARDLTQVFTMDTAGITGFIATSGTGTVQEGGEGAAQVVAIDDRANPELFDVTNSADRGSVYAVATATPLGPLVGYRDMLLIPSPVLTSSPVGPRKYVAAGTVSALGGSPPGIRYFAVYKDRVVGASADTDMPNRLFFSGAGNAESWDTTNRWMDMPAPPIAVAPLPSCLLAFHSGSVSKIRGDIPPGSAAANMEKSLAFEDVGIFGSFALATSGESAYFADENGVYKTDGTSFSDLTKQGGIVAYWRTQVASVGVGGSVAVGVWRGYLFASLLSSDDTYVAFLACEIDSRSWFRLTNIRAYNFAAQYGATDELYFSNRDTTAKQVGKLSSIFSPASGVKNDADGDAVAPVLETGLYPVKGAGKKRWRNIYVTHDTRDAATDNPIQTVSIIPDDPASTSYTALTPTLPETTARARKRVPVGKQSYGIAFKIAQSNASSDTRLYSLEAEVEGREGSRL